MDVYFHVRFRKRYRKLRSGERKQCDERIALFIRDSLHPLLNNHPLNGEYTGYRSINITGDLRAIYEPISKNRAFFSLLGTHQELYE